MPLINSKSKVETISLNINNVLYKNAILYCMNEQVPFSSLISSVAALAISEYTHKIDFNFFNMNHGRVTFYQKQTIGNMTSTFLNFYHIDKEETIDEFVRKSYLDYLESLKHCHVSVFEKLLVTLRTELRLLRFNYYGCIISNITFNKTSDNSNYEFGQTPYNHQPNQLYCLISDNNKDEAIISLLFQSKIISKDNVNAIVQRFIEILACVSVNQKLQIKEVINI